ITVTAAPGSLPVADFDASPRTGNGPLNVMFTNLSSNATGFLWNFGDGTTSTDANPSHTYAPGAYAVSLLAANASGNDTETKVDYIVVVGATGSTPGGSTPGGSTPGGSTPTGQSPTSGSSFSLPRSGGGGGGCSLGSDGGADPASFLPYALLAAALGLVRLLRSRTRRDPAKLA
ncbi:MAG: PKD domain-containing protein, partial [Actinobacteria bacterium]|nr:PKD domain-containing protein [Actinomycetota bacterium]